jgi:putative transposase
MRYRRTHVAGATVFLTLVTAQRQPVLLEATVRSALRNAVAHVSRRHPFKTIAFVVLPDHCHLLWRLPEQDGDYSLRIRLIKHHMARQDGIPRPLWQKRFWEHLIRDEDDLKRHLDYIHYNPVKHGHARVAQEWEDSSFRRFVDRGVYAQDWGVSGDLIVLGE